MFLLPQLEKYDEGIMQYRQHNIETCSGLLLAVLREPSKRGPHKKSQQKKKKSPTNSSDGVEAVQITSSSDTEDAEASSLNQEVTSPSNNEDNAADTKANEGIPKADTCEEVTSPSSEILSLVSVNDDVWAHTRPSKIRKVYTVHEK
jgi:hypothetical protein